MRVVHNVPNLGLKGTYGILVEMGVQVTDDDHMRKTGRCVHVIGQRQYELSLPQTACSAALIPCSPQRLQPTIRQNVRRTQIIAPSARTRAIVGSDKWLRASYPLSETAYWRLNRPSRGSWSDALSGVLASPPRTSG